MPATAKRVRYEFLTVTLLPGEKAAIKRAAARSGHQMSAWARWAMLSKLKPDTPVEGVDIQKGDAA